MSEARVDILIANPGTHPEMMQFAAALGSGFSTAYATSSNFSHDSLLMNIAARLERYFPQFSAQLLRRQLPPELGKSKVIHRALLQEAAFQAFKKVNRRLARDIMNSRNKAFGRQMQQVVADTAPRLIVSQYTASSSVFEAAPPECLRVLNYPIAHHRWLRETMRTEASVNPKWAPTLHGHDLTDREIEMLDLEIEEADFVLVPSSFVARTFQQSGVPETKLITLPLGCDIHRGNRDRRVDRDGELHVLFAGQVTQRKGIGYLAEAIKALPQARLTVIGDCPPAARNLLSSYPRVEILPTVPRHVLRTHMSEADVLVLPSLAEGFPLVAIEAMSVGCPVLISRATFADDLVEDGVNGFVLPRISVDSILEQLQRIQGWTRITELSDSAIRTAENYSWENYRDRAREVAAGLISGRKPAGAV